MSFKYSCNLLFNFSTAIFRVFFSWLNSSTSIPSTILFIFGISTLKKSFRFEKLYTFLIPSIKLRISTTFAFFNSSIFFQFSQFFLAFENLIINRFCRLQSCHIHLPPFQVLRHALILYQSPELVLLHLPRQFRKIRVSFSV